jgi:hypothetical protein
MPEGSNWIFSFDNICELLGLDPEYIRRGLQEWRVPTEAQQKLRRRSGSRMQAA